MGGRHRHIGRDPATSGVAGSGLKCMRSGSRPVGRRREGIRLRLPRPRRTRPWRQPVAEASDRGSCRGGGGDALSVARRDPAVGRSAVGGKGPRDPASAAETSSHPALEVAGRGGVRPRGLQRRRRSRPLSPQSRS
jgi:hypothetical protein